MKIILFANGTTKEITNDQEAAIYECSSGPAKHIKIDGELIAFAGIMRIMDADKYYMETDKERPQHSNYTVTNYKKLPEPTYTKERAVRGVECMRKGLINQIAQTEMTPKKQRMLDRMDRSLKAIKNAPVGETHLSFAKII